MERSRLIKKGGVREMVAVALPMVISYACETVMIFTDRMFLSRLGPEFMNASMAGGTTVYMMMTFFLGLTGYTAALSAQYYGSGQKNKASLVVTQAALIALSGYPLIMICRPAAYFLFHKAGIGSEQMEPQLLYFNIIVCFLFVPLLRHTLSGYFTGISRTRIVMSASFVSMIVNVGANYVLIFGKLGFPAMGISGAAYGTVTGAACGLGILLIAYLKRENRKEFSVRKSLRFNRDVMGKLLRFGTPAGIEMFLNILAFDFMVLIFHAVGPVAATAATVALNWDMISYIPLLGLEIGVTSLVGRYMGARDINSAKRSTWSAVKMGLVYSTMILVVFAVFTEPLVDIFHSAKNDSLFGAARPSAIFMLRLTIIYIWVESVFVVLIGSLRGAGDTFWSMCFSVALHWVMIPVLYIMMHVYHAPIEQAWLTMIVVFMCSSGLLVSRYRQGKWKEFRVIEDESIQKVLVRDNFHERPEL